MNKLDFLESLIENDSILLKQHANDWKESIFKCFDPLLKNNLITLEYINGVIENTQKYGPYYIICPNLAMPHYMPNKENVLKNGFSLLIFSKPILFDNNPIQILIGFAATNSDIHMSVALPQIVAIFENQETIQKIINSSSKEEIINIIKNINYLKYVNGKEDSNE